MSNALDQLTEPMHVEPLEERIILAGDMALRFGLALGSTKQGLIASTTFDATDVRRATDIGRGVSWAADQIADWAAEWVWGIDKIAFEEPAGVPGNPNMLAQFGMVVALMQGAALGGWGSDSISYWPTNVKKRATGSGRADKATMCKFASAFAHRRVEDHDEADALLILQIALADERKRLETMRRKHDDS